MIAEGPLLAALEAVHSGSLRVHEAYRQIRAADDIQLRRCLWESCPGLEKSIPMHEQEDGPEYHDLCRAAMVAPYAISELNELYRQLAQDRKARA